MTENNKTTRTEKIESFLFTLQLVCVVLSVYYGIWQVPKAMSILIAISFIITGFLAFIAIANKNNKYTVIIWVFITLLSFFGMSRGKPDFSFDYMKEWIIFMSTVNLFFWVYTAKVNDGMIKRIFICGLATACIFILAFFMGKTKANSKLPELVTFGLSNPNLAGIYILNVFLCVFILARFLKGKFLKLLCYLICGVLFYFIYLTRARSCIIAAIICILFSFMPHKKYSRFLTFMVMIFPLVFVFVYLNLIDTDVAYIFRFMESEGKSLTSRVKIWERVLKIIENNILMGNYYLGAGNKHNTHLMILAAFGVPAFSLVIIFLNRIVNYIGQFIKNKYQFAALYSFYAVIIMGTFEAALFSGVQEMYVFSGAFLMIAKYLTTKDSINDKITE